MKRGYSTLKSMLLMYSVIKLGIFDAGSRTTSSRATTFGPPARFCRILISRLIFFFLTGFKTLMMHFSSVMTFTPSKTWERDRQTAFRKKQNKQPQSIFRVRLFWQFHNGPVSPTAPGDCLANEIRRWKMMKKPPYRIHARLVLI